LTEKPIIFDKWERARIEHEEKAKEFYKKIVS